MSKGFAMHVAGEFIGAKRARAKVRSNLATARKQWLEAHEVYYSNDPDERSWWGADEHALSEKIETALRERADCNKRYRKALAKLDKCFGEGLA